GGRVARGGGAPGGPPSPGGRAEKKRACPGPGGAATVVGMRERLEAAYQKALAALLAERTPEGHWVGELSPSALSTATAVMALNLVNRDAHAALIERGVAWLAAHQNADGGWGDTVKSVSNISTTMLGRAAFHLAGAA